MKYTKRVDGRKFDELRQFSAKVGIVKNARGSALFQIGKTIAIAAVYGPKELFPKHLQLTDRALLRCHYNMMAFSGSGERVRPGGNRRSKELGLVIEKALLPVLFLKGYPRAVVDVYIELLQTDSGTRCAGICAASLALADAGFEMKDLIASVSCGVVGNQPVVDLNKEEEDYEGGAVDIPIAITPRTGEITLLQLDGEISREDFSAAIEMGKKACLQIYVVQQKALRAKYQEVEQ